MDKMQLDISRITKSIRKAYGGDMANFYDRYSLITNNAEPGLRWDFINTNIGEQFKDEIYKILLVQRGYWNQVLIYNNRDKRLYFIMREDRYKEVGRDKKRKSLHLVQILASVNEEEESEASREFKLKLPEYVSKAKEFILITYEYDKNNYKFDFIGRKITSKFKSIYEKEWSSHSLNETGN